MRDQAPRGLDVGGGPTIKQILLVLGIVFVIALAVIVTQNMSPDAMAVIIGIVCGIAAGIPTSILLLVVLTRRERQQEEQTRQLQQNYPPVVVIQGGNTPTGSPYQGGEYWPAPRTPAMLESGSTDPRFRVVADDLSNDWQ